MDTLHHHYWGKLDKEGHWHHLCHHCLDVAAVVDALLDANPLWAKRLYEISPYTPDITRKHLLFWASVHDIGKFGDAFQLQEIASICIPSLGRKIKETEKHHHTLLGLCLFEKIYEDIDAYFPNEYALTPLITAAFCHHGMPTTEPLSTIKVCKNDVLKDIKTFVCDMAEFFELPKVDEIRFENGTFCEDDIFRLMSWLCAGLFILADWIGSNTIYFPMDCVWNGPKSYYPKALAQAKTAVATLHLGEFANGAPHDFYSILPNFPDNATPSPMQAAMLSLPELQSQELIIIEDVTGAGKTEAALIALNRFLCGGQGTGVFIALPTMATANAMYSRMSSTYQSIFTHAHASLLLAHGNSVLNNDYLASLFVHPDEPATYSELDHQHQGTAYCSQWLADSRKKALLAPCGVGTIDQALLAILKVKHQALRLFGLSRSVLIVDEVHAFDSYTGALIANCLRFHAALGGSAILLSATLPQSLRASFVAAWNEGLAAKKRLYSALEKRAQGSCMEQDALPLPRHDSQDYAPFPLYTRVFTSNTGDTILEETAVSSTRSLHVGVKSVFDEAAMFNTLHEAHARGACAVWVRNTVGDVCDAYAKLVESGIISPENIHVFHARFCGADRERIENSVLSMFGKQSTPTCRDGHILLASQVVEQSLDLDFDILLSDLAPIDVLIQRAGRCHRHKRPRHAGYEQAVMQVYMPNPEENLTPAWYKALFPHGAYVYERTAFLWRTAKLLCDSKKLELPLQARYLIENVYGEGMDYPEAFDEAQDRADGKDHGDVATADYVGLNLLTGYVGDGWESDMRVPTRLGADTVNVRLFCLHDDGTLGLFGAEKDSFSMRDCLRAELRVRISMLQEADNLEQYNDALTQCKELMRDKGKWSVCLVLQKITEADGHSTWQARAIKQNGQPVDVLYSSKFGLSIL